MDSQGLAEPLYQLRHGNQKQQEAFRELQQLFCLDRQTLINVITQFDTELKAGLADDRKSDLDMIPSYVTGYPTGNEKGTYLALEIAGMDIYACQVKLKGDSGKLAINQYQYKITPDLTSGDDFTVMIDYVVECIADFLTRVGTQENFTYPMAVSFGFAIKQMGLDSGRIMSLGHGFSYPNGVGVDVVQMMHERVRLKGLPIKIVAIANDAVCTLLAHAYQHPSTRLGIVHSLGTNCAYYERTRNVTKLRDQPPKDKDMIINTEWGNFGSSRRTLPCTWFDRKLDRESINPQFHVFEKMTTGIFLGELVRNVLIYLVDRDLVFGGETSETLNRAYSFDTSYMYVCESDESQDLEDTRIVLEDMMDLSKTSLADREIVKNVCELIGSRAAMLVGAAVAAVVQHMVNEGIGVDEDRYAICRYSSRPWFVFINHLFFIIIIVVVVIAAAAISGNIYEDYPSFHPRVCGTLKDLIPDHVASRLSVGIVKHSRIVGAAIVAMMAEKITAASP
ncbi:glucokinase [Apophysomyces sp. BC1034]|nr:glucokinase [Apophysomyces sp. BC1015]KAG0174349.1 glucokinase [Apophysomyces sp. BC1021]KAG0190558.1 glucokinase [Apophysomyces sp. BC1034]